MPKKRPAQEQELALPLPSSISVLGHTYSVAQTDLSGIPELPNPQDALGISVHSRLMIRVRNDLAPETAFSTFVHEVAHAVAAQGGSANLISGKNLETICDIAGATVMCLIAGGVLQRCLPQRPSARRRV